MDLLKNEKGMMAIETITTFVIFYMAMVLILLLVHVSSAQLRVQYALAQIAKEEVIYRLIGMTPEDPDEQFKKYMNIYSGANEIISADTYLSTVRVYGGLHGVNGDGGVKIDVKRGNPIVVTATYHIDFLPFRLLLRDERLQLPPVTKTVQLQTWGNGDKN